MCMLHALPAVVSLGQCGQKVTCSCPDASLGGMPVRTDGCVALQNAALAYDSDGDACDTHARVGL